jgi:hypothetical protein
MRSIHRVLVATTACVLVGGMAACSSGPATSTTAAPGTEVSREAQAVSSVRPRIDALVAALRQNDLAAARTAYADYDAGWNGVEVYVNVRDMALYTTLEKDLQDPIGEAVATDSPDLAALVPVAEKLGTTYDQAIANSTTGTALSPLFDDVTTLRIVRADLRRATNDLELGDVTAARTHFGTFADAYPTVQPLVTMRSDSADGQISSAISAARKELGESDTTDDELTPLLATVTARYNVAVSLWNVAARNADVSRSAAAPADIAGARMLRQVEAALGTSATAWKQADYAAASAAAQQAQVSFDTVVAALTGKKAVPDVDKAIDTYAAEAAAAGDAAKVPADATAAIEASQVAEQALVGQFWTDPAVREQLAAAPTG